MRFHCITLHDSSTSIHAGLELRLSCPESKLIRSKLWMLASRFILRVFVSAPHSTGHYIERLDYLNTNDACLV